MRTRSRSYPSSSDGITFFIRPTPPPKRRKLLPPPSPSILPSSSPALRHRFRRPSTGAAAPLSSPLDSLHDDLLVCIMARLSATVSRPSHLINAMLTCKRLCAAGAHPEVLAAASTATIAAVQPSTWSGGARRYLQRCAAAGNAEAAYTLGMILFYCEKERAGGASLLARAAMRGHAAALHSLAIIQFNGSGRSRKEAKDVRRGVRLCAKAAALGHVGATRELGHCLMDGYGVARRAEEGRRLLLQANVKEQQEGCQVGVEGRCGCQLSRDGPCRVGVEGRCRPHVSGHGAATPLLEEAARGFLVGWFASRPPEAGLRMCSYGLCGRPETRRHEFRRCSACGAANYCSRSCQAQHWKLHHKISCAVPVPQPAAGPPPAQAPAPQS